MSGKTSVQHGTGGNKEKPLNKKPILRFFLDAGSGVCLWAGNESARQQFGYPITLERLPLSNDLMSSGQGIIEDYNKSMDWNNPAGRTIWDAEKCRAFNQRVEKFLVDMQNQLGEGFRISNEFRPVTAYKSRVAGRMPQTKSISSSDLKKIERSLEIELPQEYKEILGNYPRSADRALETCLSNREDWVIRQNKMVRRAKNSSCPRKDWLPKYLVIGEDGHGNRYYIDIRQSPSPVYLYEREHPDNRQQVAPSLVEWALLVREQRQSFLKSLPDEGTRCPGCQLLGGSRVISTRQTGRKILRETQYETEFRDGEFATCKCQFCGHRWEEDRSRTYIEVDWPRNW